MRRRESLSQPGSHSSYSVGLLEEGVEVELLRRRAARDHHQRARRHERVAVDERRGAVGAQLGGAEPLEQRERTAISGRPAIIGRPRVPIDSRIISAVL